VSKCQEEFEAFLPLQMRTLRCLETSISLVHSVISQKIGILRYIA